VSAPDLAAIWRGENPSTLPTSEATAAVIVSSVPGPLTLRYGALIVTVAKRFPGSPGFDGWSVYNGAPLAVGDRDVPFDTARRSSIARPPAG
jgi:hypothetical protein